MFYAKITGMDIFLDQLFTNDRDSFRFDLIYVDGQLISTVEIKQSSRGFSADAWISARFEDNELSLILRFQAPLGQVEGEKEAAAAFEALYIRVIKPLAMESIALGGLADSINPPDPSTRRRLAWAHLKLHADAGHIPFEKSPVAVRTALEYKLIKSFGFHAATPLIAEFEGINTVAVDQRLHMAREAKLLAKVSVVAGKNNLRKSGSKSVA